MKRKVDWARSLYYMAMVAIYCFITALINPLQVFAAEWSSGSSYTSSSKDIGSFASSVAEYVMVAVMAIAFVAGAVMVTMGLVGFAQKRDNPEAAQGAPRKLMAGGALLAITVILGVLKATLSSAG